MSKLSITIRGSEGLMYPARIQIERGRYGIAAGFATCKDVGRFFDFQTYYGTEAKGMTLSIWRFRFGIKLPI